MHAVLYGAKLHPCVACGAASVQGCSEMGSVFRQRRSFFWAANADMLLLADAWVPGCPYKVAVFTVPAYAQLLLI
jgi:Ni,Fe-hydrogenase III small subunit